MIILASCAFSLPLPNAIPAPSKKEKAPKRMNTDSSIWRTMAVLLMRRLQDWHQILNIRDHHEDFQERLPEGSGLRAVSSFFNSTGYWKMPFTNWLTSDCAEHSVCRFCVVQMPIKQLTPLNLSMSQQWISPFLPSLPGFDTIGYCVVSKLTVFCPGILERLCAVWLSSYNLFLATPHLSNGFF